MRDDPWRRSPHTGFVGTPSRVDPPPERSTQMPIARMTALALASLPTRPAARSRHPSCPFRSYFEGDDPGTVAAIRPVAEVSRHLVLQNRRAAVESGKARPAQPGGRR